MRYRGVRGPLGYTSRAILFREGQHNGGGEERNARENSKCKTIFFPTPRTGNNEKHKLFSHPLPKLTLCSSTK